MTDPMTPDLNFSDRDRIHEDYRRLFAQGEKQWGKRLEFESRERLLKEALHRALGYVRSLGATPSHPIVVEINSTLAATRRDRP